MKTLGDSIMEGAQYVGDFIVAAFDRIMTKAVNEGGLANMAKGAMTAVSNKMASAQSAMTESFSAFHGKSSAPDGHTVSQAKALAKEQSHGHGTHAMPPKVLSALEKAGLSHGQGEAIHNSHIVAASMLHVPDIELGQKQAVAGTSLHQKVLAVGA